MDSKRAHPILSQIPLIVSPFLRPPQAVTLPFNYHNLPNSIPNSLLSAQDIGKVRNDSHQFYEELVAEQRGRIKAYESWKQIEARREIEEKRRIAPGYLDTNERILQPTRAIDSDSTGDGEGSGTSSGIMSPVDRDRGSELDLVFGRVSLKEGEPNQT